MIGSVSVVLLVSAAGLGALTVLLALPLSGSTTGQGSGWASGESARSGGRCEFLRSEFLRGLRRRYAASAEGGGPSVRGRHRSGTGVTGEAAMLLRQLSALLQSGRGPGQVWEDLRRQWTRAPAGQPGHGGVSTHGGPDHMLGLMCARAAASDRSGRGAAEGLERLAAELTESLRSASIIPRMVSRGGASRKSRWIPTGPGRIRGGSRAADDVALLMVLTRLAGLMRLSEQTGAPLSRLVDELARTLDDDAETRAAIRSAVAGPRLTQLILAALPVGGVIVGQLIGADALAVLFGTAAGLGCLILGGLFMVLGVLWSHRMILGVQRHG